MGRMIGAKLDKRGVEELLGDVELQLTHCLETARSKADADVIQMTLGRVRVARWDLFLMGHDAKRPGKGKAKGEAVLFSAAE